MSQGYSFVTNIIGVKGFEDSYPVIVVALEGDIYENEDAEVKLKDNDNNNNNNNDNKQRKSSLNKTSKTIKPSKNVTKKTGFFTKKLNVKMDTDKSKNDEIDTDKLKQKDIKDKSTNDEMDTDKLKQKDTDKSKNDEMDIDKSKQKDINDESKNDKLDINDESKNDKLDINDKSKKKDINDESKQKDIDYSCTPQGKRKEFNYDAASKDTQEMRIEDIKEHHYGYLEEFIKRILFTPVKFKEMAIDKKDRSKIIHIMACNESLNVLLYDEAADDALNNLSKSIKMVITKKDMTPKMKVLVAALSKAIDVLKITHKLNV